MKQPGNSQNPEAFTEQKDFSGSGKGSVFFLWAVPLLLSAFGIVMITSGTTNLSVSRWDTPFVYGMRQTRWLLLGFTAMVACYCIPLGLWKKISGLAWFIGVTLMVLTLVPGFSNASGGSARWIDLGPVSLQASEVLFLTVIIHGAKKLHRSDLSPLYAFFQILLIFFVSSWPFAFQPDFGSAILLFALLMGLYIERYGWKYPLLFGSAVTVTVFLPLLVTSTYRMARIKAFLDPWQDPLGDGFQIIQGFIAFAKGGVWGVGLGQGLQKLKYLPAVHTDFIFAAIGEELGFVGTASILAMFFLWFFTLMLTYRKLRGTFAGTVFWGVSLSIALALFINLGGVMKLLPLTGVPLPFLSYGGSALVTLWAKIGIILRTVRDGTNESTP
ncbi:MAG: FtsW/RodA/SpoVE family cell cycle protein [Thermovirgaceae bacterium]